MVSKGKHLDDMQHWALTGRYLGSAGPASSIRHQQFLNGNKLVGLPPSGAADKCVYIKLTHGSEKRV